SDDGTRHQAARHGHHLDRQREPAEDIDLLARVDDANEPVAGLGDDLFARERGATALDQALARVALVGAVDVQGKVPRLVEIDDLDAVFAQACAALFGAGNGPLDPVPDASQGVNEVGDRGTGPDADDRAVVDVFDGLFGGEAFGFGHGRCRL